MCVTIMLFTLLGKSKLPGNNHRWIHQTIRVSLGIDDEKRYARLAGSATRLICEAMSDKQRERERKDIYQNMH